MKVIKVLFAVLIGIITMLVVALFFVSIVVKWQINENGKAYIGRKMQVEEIHFNYLTFSATIQDFTLFEKNETDTFVSFNKFHINFQPWKLLHNEYALKSLLLDGLYVNIEQEGDLFNFDDLIPASDTSHVDTTTQSGNTDSRFYFENIQITNGSFDYLDKEISNLLSFHNLDLGLPLLAWDNQESEIGVNLQIGEKGQLFIQAAVNNEKETYQLQTKLDSVQLSPFSKYLKPYMNTSTIDGTLNANLKINGSLVHTMNVVVSGVSDINNIHIPDEEGNSILYAKRLEIKIDSLDLLNEYYSIDEFLIDSPIVTAVLGKEQTNLEYLFAPVLEEDSILTTDTIATADSIIMHYAVHKMHVNNGTVLFTDSSLTRPFNYKLSAVDVHSQAITGLSDSIPIDFSMVLNETGSFKGSSSFSIANPYKLAFNGEIKTLDLMSFSPYSEYFIAHPIIQGELNYLGNLVMTNEQLKNENHIQISEIEFGTKTNNKIAIKAPIRLALYVLKDKNNNIDFELPVWGNPSDPEFSIGKIVWKTLSNFLIKTASTPFKAVAGLISTDPESIKQINFEFTQDSLGPQQKKVLNQLAAISAKDSTLRFTLIQETAVENEVNQLALKLASTKFLLSMNEAYSMNDTIQIINKWDAVIATDSAFVQFINDHSSVSVDSDLNEKIVSLVGQENLTKHFNDLLAVRNELIKNYLFDTKKVNQSSVTVRTADLKNIRVQSSNPIFRVQVSLK